MTDTAEPEQPDLPATIDGLYRLGCLALCDARKRDAELDCGILLEFSTGHGALSRLTNPTMHVDKLKAQVFWSLIDRRIAGEPVHRITGSREFYGLDLQLSPQTLVPRPDTEVLVDAAIPFLRDVVSSRSSCRVLDLGTGSGAIALALVNEVPGIKAIGVDVSAEAVATANANARRLGLDASYTAIVSNWFSNVRGTYDLIISNPPYIDHREIDDLDVEVRLHDPLVALDGGVDGMDCYGLIAARIGPFLANNGRVMFEIGANQKAQVTACMLAAGLSQGGAWTDLTGLDRVVEFKK